MVFLEVLGKVKTVDELLDIGWRHEIKSYSRSKPRCYPKSKTLWRH